MISSLRNTEAKYQSDKKGKGGRTGKCEVVFFFVLYQASEGNRMLGRAGYMCYEIYHITFSSIFNIKCLCCVCAKGVRI